MCKVRLSWKTKGNLIVICLDAHKQNWLTSPVSITVCNQTQTAKQLTVITGVEKGIEEVASKVASHTRLAEHGRTDVTADEVDTGRAPHTVVLSCRLVVRHLTIVDVVTALNHTSTDTTI